MSRPSIPPAVQKKLEQARVARLATIDAQGAPHLVPICFVYEGGAFYMAIDRKPKRVAPERLARLDNMARNPQVALLIDEYSEDWQRLWYVLVRGRAELLAASADAEQGRALALLKAKYPQYAGGWLGDDAPVVRITVTKITHWGEV